MWKHYHGRKNGQWSMGTVAVMVSRKKYVELLINGCNMALGQVRGQYENVCNN